MQPKIQYYSGSYRRRGARRLIKFRVKEPLMLTMDDGDETTSGCCLVDMLFARPTAVAELTFNNYYTAGIDIAVRVADGGGCSSGDSGGDDRRTPSDQWRVSVVGRQLMPSPHMEHGSQDVVSIYAKDSVCPWKDLLAMRLILRQPSPSWDSFYVNDVRLFQDPPFSTPRPIQHEHPIGGPPCKEFSSLLALVRQQTIDALRNAPGKRLAGPAFDPDAPKYEFFHLPKV